MTDSIRDTADRVNRLSIKATVFDRCLFYSFGDFIMTEYKTVKSESSDEFTEKKSRFIGYVKPVSTQSDAVDFINSIKSKHWDATHNVYAYALRENNICRSSDDGEPSGTAGVPVLDVLMKEKVVDACVVVTRYFGGTLLGAGGLVRAYSHASKIALDAGGIITMAECAVLGVRVDYSFYERVIRLLKSFQVSILATDFTDDVYIKFNVKLNCVSKLEDELTQLSNGAYTFEKLGRTFAAI